MKDNFKIKIFIDYDENNYLILFNFKLKSNNKF